VTRRHRQTRGGTNDKTKMTLEKKIELEVNNITTFVAKLVSRVLVKVLLEEYPK
jgi:hypothetical protein